ncbi:MAG: Stealth CR1 domain-containing protein [Erysipelotrichaceae bacterium]|nr:Stealth CR1 domain-containing protein [Erysipelotrichaceae bacterium]
MNDAIDIIIPWVDNSDPEWHSERDKYLSSAQIDTNANSEIRYQSWDILKYLFRGIEKYMPWFHQLIFVTYGHLPSFLDVHHPKLRVVKHSEYIPAQYLPTFNSNTIEMNYYRIEDLAENFILFNDDFFPLQPIEETYFFKNNKVCDEAVEGVIVPINTDLGAIMSRYCLINNLSIINKYFKKREVQQKNWDKWYCDDYGELLERTKSMAYWDNFMGFRDPHLPSAMKKSTIAKLWDLEYDALNKASCNRFRSYNDISQWLIRYWQLCEGDFEPRRTRGKFYLVDIENCDEVVGVIKGQSQKMIGLNENCIDKEFKVINEKINRAFATILPEKCSFEK